MKIIKSVLLALILCGPVINCAQAGVHVGSAGRSASSSIFKSGFSSQKSAISRAAPAADAKKASFGSFGSNATAPSPTAAATGSALARDLNSTSANANALKTLDARNQAAQPVAPAYAAADSLPGANPAYPVGTSYVPQTVVVQHSGFSSNPFLWFMLGHSMTGGDRDRVVYVNGSTENQAAPGGQAGANPPVPASMPQEAPTTTLLGSVLRVLLWTAILSAAICGAVYYFARRTANAAKHYSL